MKNDRLRRECTIETLSQNQTTNQPIEQPTTTTTKNKVIVKVNEKEKIRNEKTKNKK